MQKLLTSPPCRVSPSCYIRECRRKSRTFLEHKIPPYFYAASFATDAVRADKEETMAKPKRRRWWRETLLFTAV